MILRMETNFPGNRIKRFLWDLSGAFGDIGVLLPIAIALIAKNGFNPTALFLTAGMFYILSSAYFKITMPVQPLKAMSAIAITMGLSPQAVNGAGIAIGLILIVLSLSGLSVRLGKYIPLSVIRGIQFGLGLMLIKTSWMLVTADASVAIAAGVLLMASILMIKNLPPFIPLLIFAVPIMLESMTTVSIGPATLTPALPDFGSLWVGLVMLALPQIALTFGNAVVATEATGRILYGGRAGRLNLMSIPLSMGVANILSGVLGGAPMCHGSGGITAHRKFGATSERSGYIIGCVLIVMAVLFGNSALSLLAAFPAGILGVMLCHVGIQHTLFLKDILREKEALPVAVTVAVSGFITNNLTLGFLLGIGLHYVITAVRNTPERFGIEEEKSHV